MKQRLLNKRRLDHKRVSRGEEIYTVGFSAVGGKIEDPEVFVHSLFENKPSPRLAIDVPRVRLSATVDYLVRIVNPGITSTYFVNIFTHRAGQREIRFCHFNYASKPILLTYGEWKLVLRARGSNSSEEGVIHLLLQLDENGSLVVKRDRINRDE